MNRWPRAEAVVLTAVVMLGLSAPCSGESGPVALWRFDGDASAVAADSAGEDNPGRLQGDPRAVRVRHDGGAALGFFAAGQEVTGPDKHLPGGAAAGSISLWFVRPRGVSDKVLFVYGASRRGRARGLWLTAKDRLCFYFWGDPKDLHVRIPGGVTAERWHHVAGTYDGATARLYYDGKLVGQVAHRIDTAVGGVFRIGANLVDDHRDFIGLIDEVTVHARALSGEEIRQAYRREAGRLGARSAADFRAYRAASKRAAGKADASRRAKLGELAGRAGVEDVVFAVRQPGKDGHWYANFSHWADNPTRRLYGDGGKLCVLTLRTGRVRTLLDDPGGGVRDPQVHYDGGKILFSYRKGGQPYYHLYEIGVDGSGLRQLTDGPYDDIEPTYLPDPPGRSGGGIVFCSSRARCYVPCYYTRVAVLHRCDADGSNIRRLSANVEHENTPWPLADGRILYQRWEYVDRSQVWFHHLWTTNPDGTGQMVFYGNMNPGGAFLDAKEIPGTDRVVMIHSPGHGRCEHAGRVEIVDPGTGPDRKSAARAIRSDWVWRDPYPLSEKTFLVAGPGGRRLSLMSSAGRHTVIYDLPAAQASAGLWVHEPRPIRRRPRERVLYDRTDPAQVTGRAVLQDLHVGRNVPGLRPGEIKKLLVMEILPVPVKIVRDWQQEISFDGPAGGSFLLERILGVVPVEADGSAYFELPALRPVFFVALDAAGRSVKRMHSFVTVQPGERVGCVGCHEHRTQAPAGGSLVSALGRAPSRIEPVEGIPDVFDFPRDIQPILDKHCLACHGYERTDRGGPRSGGVILSGDRGAFYSHSYAALRQAGQYVDGRNAGGNTPPRSVGATASAIMKKLDGSHHDVDVPAREKDRVRYWIESAAVYAGTYAALGTGMVDVKLDGGLFARRCRRCHRRKLHGAVTDPKYHLYYNLTRPEKSLVLLAPLSPAAGGWGMRAKDSKDARRAWVFENTGDPDYRKTLAAIRRAARRLEVNRRFDMPGFRPSPHYLREMVFYGILPTDRPEGRAIDVYAIDRAYWRSLWYHPPGQRVEP